MSWEEGGDAPGAGLGRGTYGERQGVGTFCIRVSSPTGLSIGPAGSIEALGLVFFAAQLEVAKRA